MRREPDFLRRFEELELYERMIARNQDKPLFVLHDGPPYANGNIHPGTILNKVLKDIVVKYRNMSGRLTEYIPGWDCHGLPIEHNVEKKLGVGKDRTPKPELRAQCRKFALNFVDIQREEFKRLGVLGRWAEPYLTLHRSYEATIAREFGAFVRSGAIYRGRKPVQWCHECGTALAEAEVEYHNHKSPSIFVKFPVCDDVRQKLPEIGHGTGDEAAAFVIWTTTPWTIPANLAIALHPEHEYAVMQTSSGEHLIVAAYLAPVFAEAVGLGEYSIVRRFEGRLLDGTNAKHPFIDRRSKIILADHVTLEAGTGCVHTAPGHGAEDYEVGRRYGLDSYAPVDGEGRFTSDVEHFAGKLVFDANDDVCELLRARGMLLAQSDIEHSYPHCWRSKTPVIFRSTDQWFISMSLTGLRDKALEEISRVKWIPRWGEDRFRGMVQNRPDWCISRQRSWGVPIPAFYCRDCGNTLLDADVIDHVANIFEEQGADSWFTASEEELLPTGTRCPKCEGGNFRREEDIIDVWFESGVSFAAVMEPHLAGKGRGEGTPPVDLYLEGSDQHRGWFQSAMLTSVGTRGHAPYKAVLTHGFVVDGDGRKMSKSEGNFLPPEQVLKRYGAEIFRLWVASEDYREDIRLSDEILKNLSDAYRKLRNTARFLLSNLYDFDPDRHEVAPALLRSLPECSIDRFALHRLQEVTAKALDAYERYEFHPIHFGLLDFMAGDLSSFYLDVLKDRLYASAPESEARRAAQTVMYEILRSLTLLSAPITSFTSHELWEQMPKRSGDPESVFLADMPAVNSDWRDTALAADFVILKQARSVALRAIEEARNRKVVGHSLAAALTLQVAADTPQCEVLERYSDRLATLFIVSEARLEALALDSLPEEAREHGLAASVTPAVGQKCSRCWIRATSVGQDARHPELCARCSEVVRGLTDPSAGAL